LQTHATQPGSRPSVYSGYCIKSRTNRLKTDDQDACSAPPFKTNSSSPAFYQHGTRLENMGSINKGQVQALKTKADEKPSLSFFHFAD
jgi:hypothetical protein